jgi:hypothetical protein
MVDLKPCQDFNLLWKERCRSTTAVISRRARRAVANSLTARTGAEDANTFTGSEADLDRLVQQLREAV